MNVKYPLLRKTLFSDVNSCIHKIFNGSEMEHKKFSKKGF